jgi:hypothetical protein
MVFFIRVLICGLIVGLLLGACSSSPPPSAPLPDGDEVAPPGGWLSFCIRNPGDPLCASH